MRCAVRVAAAVVVIAAGCSTGGGARPVASPLEQKVGFDPLTNAWRADELQAKMVTCMNSHGFEYVAYPPPVHDPKSVASTSGYGVTIGALDPRPANAASASTPNPNDKITSKMSPSEFAAYRTALYGPEEEIRTNPPIDSIGCLRRAQRELYGKDGQMTPGLISVINDVTARVKASASVGSAQAKWSQCMTSAGYGFPDSDAARSSISKEFEAVTGSTGGAAHAGAVKDQSALLKLFEKEKSIAVRDAACSKSSGLDTAMAAEILKAEQQYIDAHPDIHAQVFGS